DQAEADREHEAGGGDQHDEQRGRMRERERRRTGRDSAAGRGRFGAAGVVAARVAVAAFRARSAALLQARSTRSAMPRPPETHSVAIPYRPFTRASSESSATTMRLPLMPVGCPR